MVFGIQDVQLTDMRDIRIVVDANIAPQARRDVDTFFREVFGGRIHHYWLWNVGMERNGYGCVHDYWPEKSERDKCTDKMHAPANLHAVGRAAFVICGAAYKGQGLGVRYIDMPKWAARIAPNYLDLVI